MGIFDSLKNRSIQNEMERRIVNISETRQSIPVSCHDLHKLLNDMEKLCLPTGKNDASERRDKLIEIASKFEAARSELIAVGLRYMSLGKVATLYLELIDRCFALDFLELLNKGLAESALPPVICSSKNITILRFSGLVPAYLLTHGWKNRNAHDELTGQLAIKFSEKYGIANDGYVHGFRLVAARMKEARSLTESINSVAESAMALMDAENHVAETQITRNLMGSVMISGRLVDMGNTLNEWLNAACREHGIS